MNHRLPADLFQAQFSLANHYISSNNTKKAIEILQRIVEQNEMGNLTGPPDQIAWLYEMLADLLQSTGKKVEALELFYKAQSLQASLATKNTDSAI